MEKMLRLERIESELRSANARSSIGVVASLVRAPDASRSRPIANLDPACIDEFKVQVQHFVERHNAGRHQDLIKFEDLEYTPAALISGTASAILEIIQAADSPLRSDTVLVSINRVLSFNETTGVMSLHGGQVDR